MRLAQVDRAPLVPRALGPERHADRPVAVGRRLGDGGAVLAAPLLRGLRPGPCRRPSAGARPTVARYSIRTRTASTSRADAHCAPSGGLISTANSDATTSPSTSATRSSPVLVLARELALDPRGEAREVRRAERLRVDLGVVGEHVGVDARERLPVAGASRSHRERHLSRSPSGEPVEHDLDHRPVRRRERRAPAAPRGGRSPPGTRLRAARRGGPSPPARPATSTSPAPSR